MVTHFRVGTNHHVERLTLHVSSVSPVPKSYREAFNDVNWHSAMRDEYNALIKNSTWTLVPRPPDVNVVRCMWLFCHEYLADGMLSRYKARLVANGSTQLEGVDVDETFSPVVKPGTIRTVLSLAASRHWPVHQLDVKNAFLHWDLSETVYMHQPPSFWDSTHPNYVAYFSAPFMGSSRPLALGKDSTYLLLYVDDIALTASSSDLLHRIISSLHQEFAMTGLGSLNYFLGISVTRDSSGMFLSREKYAVDILECDGMVYCNPSRTPVDTESKLGTTGDVVSDPTLYWSLACSLQYLTFTRPDISYAVHYSPLLPPTWLLIQMQTRLVVLLLDDRLKVTVSFLATIYSHGLLSVNRRFLVPVPRQSIVLLQMLLLRPVGYATYWVSYILQFVFRYCVYCEIVRSSFIYLTRYQFVDIFTKGLPTALFEEFRSSLSVLTSF
ncbi:ribonuclease H-like domain-containing protein [Tanacetum coccineum]